MKAQAKSHSTPAGRNSSPAESPSPRGEISLPPGNNPSSPTESPSSPDAISLPANLERGLRRGPAGGGDAAAQAAGAAGRLRLRIVKERLADVYYGPLESPFGTLHGAVTRKGLVRLAFPEEDPEEMVYELARRLSPRIVEGGPALDPVQDELDQYFAATRRRFELSIDWTLVGAFGRRVLKRTAGIPYGGYLSYGEIAAEAGSPGGARAAGNALGANPIPIVVPCHRVLRAGGAIGGYGGGLDRKRYLLELEGAFTARL